MFSKVKCPTCGAKNSKERMTCVECGASLDLGQVNRQVTEVPPEDEPTVMTPTQETQRAPESTYPTQPAAKSAQRTAIGFFGKIKEKVRDKTRDDLCAGLLTIGVDACMAERGQPEEHTTRHGEKSMGLIEIRGSPIHWVNVVKHDADKVAYHLVPDASVPTPWSLELESVRVKKVPLFGPVVDLRWKANFTESSPIRRLIEDALLKQRLIGLKEDIKKRRFPQQRCWAIFSSVFPIGYQILLYSEKGVRQPAPSRELWECYETIAHHLVSDTFRPGID